MRGRFRPHPPLRGIVRITVIGPPPTSASRPNPPQGPRLRGFGRPPQRLVLGREVGPDRGEPAPLRVGLRQEVVGDPALALGIGRVVHPEQRATELEVRDRDIDVIRGQRAGVALERFMKAALGHIEALSVVFHRAEVRPRHADPRMMIVVRLAVDCDLPAVRGFGIVPALLVFREVGDIVERERHLGVVGPEEALADGECAIQRDTRLVELVLVRQRPAQLRKRRSDFEMIFAPPAAVDLVRLAEVTLGFGRAPEVALEMP